MKESILYKKLPDKKVQCLNCPHYCLISNGEKGICQVKENKNGVLYSLNYGKVVAINIDPIEKKPLFHFLPGTKTFSLAAVGCNFRCASCQNWHISQLSELKGKVIGEDLSAQEIVDLVDKLKIPSISYTYTDPIAFSDFALDIMILAKSRGIKNIWVSNGFWSEELFDLIYPYLDAANIDLKSSEDDFYVKYCGGKLKPVLETLKRLKEKNIWTEITTLVIPTLNDKEKVFESISKFINNNLGSETPWHISKFSGELSWKLKNLPDTPVKTLERAYEIGKKSGLKYIYLGNVFGHKLENTFCPKCGNLVIKRVGYKITRYDKNGICPKCGTKLFISELTN